MESTRKKTLALLIYLLAFFPFQLNAYTTPWQSRIESITSIDDLFNLSDDLWTRIDLVLSISADCKQKNDILKELLKSIELFHNSIDILLIKKSDKYLIEEVLSLVSLIEENFDAAFWDCNGIDYKKAGALFLRMKERLKLWVDESNLRLS